MSTDTQTWPEITDYVIGESCKTGIDSSTSRLRMCTQTWPGNMVGKSCKPPTHMLKVNDLIKDQQLKFM